MAFGREIPSSRYSRRRRQNDIVPILGVQKARRSCAGLICRSVLPKPSVQIGYSCGRSGGLVASRLRDRSRVDPFVFSPVAAPSAGARSVLGALSDRVPVSLRLLGGVGFACFCFVLGVRSAARSERLGVAVSRALTAAAPAAAAAPGCALRPSVALGAGDPCIEAPAAGLAAAPAVVFVPVAAPVVVVAPVLVVAPVVVVEAPPETPTPTAAPPLTP